MKRVYLEAKTDYYANKNYGIVEGELLTFKEYQRLGLNNKDIRFFEMVELDSKDTYRSFGIRLSTRFAEKRYLTADEREKYL